MSRLLIIMFLLSGCGKIFKLKDLPSQIGENQGATIPQGNFPFTSSGNYTFDSNYISVTAGRATLLTVDQNFSEASDFSSGTHVGTRWDGSSLTIGNAGGCDGSTTQLC